MKFGVFKYLLMFFFVFLHLLVFHSSLHSTFAEQYSTPWPSKNQLILTKHSFTKGGFTAGRFRWVESDGKSVLKKQFGWCMYTLQALSWLEGFPGTLDVYMLREAFNQFELLAVLLLNCKWTQTTDRGTKPREAERFQCSCFSSQFFLSS